MLLNKISLGFLSLFISILISASLTACGGQKDSAPVGTGKGPSSGNDASGKPVIGEPPHYLESQFKKGQWIQWRKTSSDGTKECLRWTVENTEDYGIELKGQVSKDCIKWSLNYVEHITFHATSGKVLEDKIVTPHSEVDGPLTAKSIFGYWYGSKVTVEFKQGEVEIGTSRYPGFQIKNAENRVFLNQPSHAFHAIVLKWAEKVDSQTLVYEFDQANPPIAANPQPEDF
jgi:hypothetical protein